MAQAVDLCKNPLPKPVPTPVQCPTPHPKYTDILKRLESLSTAFKEKEDCKSIATEIDELHKKYRDGNRSLIDPAKKLGEAKIKEKKELSIDDIKNLTSYSEQVTSSVGAILQKLQSKPHCLAEKNTSVLGAMSDIVQETTGIAAQYTGPYGIAISVGGAAVSGILRGINYLLDQHAGGVDFRDREQRKLFVANLCSYHNVRTEIEDLINPEKRMASLSVLKAEMVEKRKLILNPKADLNCDGKADHCEMCSDLDLFYGVQRALEKGYSKESHKLNQIKQLVSIEGKEWDACIALDNYAHQGEEITLSTDSIKVAKDSFEKLILTVNEIKTIPTFKTCMSYKEPKELRNINYRSLAIVEYLATTSKNTFKVAFDETIKKGQKKYMEELQWTYNPVDYLAHTVMKIDWADDEVVALTGMSNGGSAQIQREINDINLYLREMYFAKLAPDFLKWQREDVYNAIDRFNIIGKDVAKELKVLLKIKTGFFSSDSSQEIIGLLKAVAKAKNIQHAYVFSLINKLLLEMNTAKKSAQAISVYCQFFADSYTLTSEIQTFCAGQNVKDIEALLRKQTKMVEAIEAYIQWANKENKLPGDTIKDLLARVQQYRNSVKVLE